MEVSGRKEKEISLFCMQVLLHQLLLLLLILLTIVISKRPLQIKAPSLETGQGIALTSACSIHKLVD